MKKARDGGASKEGTRVTAADDANDAAKSVKYSDCCRKEAVF